MKRRKKIGVGVIIAAIAGLVPVGIQLDRWRIERRQMQAQMLIEAEMRACSEMGGHWFRGSCELSP